MSQMNPRRNESGFTLLELLLVIGVAALLLIGGITTYRLVSDGNKTTEATRLLLTIRQEAQVMAQQQGNYTGIAFDTTASGGAASPLVTGGVLRDGQRNPFNGNILVAPVNTDTQLAVTFENVVQSACTRMATAINNPAEVVSITVNGDALTVPVTAGASAGACDATVNTMVWTFP